MAERAGRRTPSVSKESDASKGRSLPAKAIAEQYEKGIDDRTCTMVESGDIYIPTGSTLLDLALTGTRVVGGGMPGGIIVEIFGESGLGKTAILSEICASSQKHGGEVMFNDPEARLDLEYSEIYGMSLQGSNYKRMMYVDEVFEDIRKWKPENEELINVYACDSLAALTTQLEMGDKGDKMGMRRAKEFSAGLRTVAVAVGQPHKLVLLTNQVRQGDFGTVTPGGKGIPFYSTIRMECKGIGGRGKNPYIIKESKLDSGAKINKTLGINIIVKTVKNTKNDPFREAPISIVFGYGIDDIRANLQYLKDMTGGTKYDAIDQEYQSMERAINCVEKGGTEAKLKEKVTAIWYEVENKLKTTRKKKTRGE